MINPGAKRDTGRGKVTLEADLVRDAARLSVSLTPEQAVRLLELTAELVRWNRTYNLTAITAPERMLTHHLLDSLAVHTDLSGTRIADVGTGAGFPGLPLALCNPERQFTLIDSSGKKTRFVEHGAQLLGLRNVTVVKSRVEDLRPAQAFDTVLARAFAPLPELLEYIAALCGPATRVLAFKGRWPEAELSGLPPGWGLTGSRQIEVPGLQAARCVLVLKRSET